jgi:hypothetical protein
MLDWQNHRSIDANAIARLVTIIRLLIKIRLLIINCDQGWMVWWRRSGRVCIGGIGFEDWEEVIFGAEAKEDAHTGMFDAGRAGVGQLEVLCGHGRSIATI